MFEFLNISALIVPFALGSWAAGIFKLGNGPAMWAVIVTVAVGGFGAEYLTYQATGIPAWMRWASIGQQSVTSHRDIVTAPREDRSEGIQNAEVMFKGTNPEQLYKVDGTGWMKKSAPEGYVYVCVPCKNEVQITVLFGPEMDAEAEKHYKDIEKGWADEKLSKGWIIERIGKELSVANANIDIERTTFGAFFNINMLEYMGTVEMINLLSHETGFVGFHQNRLVSVTLNYLDGSMDDTADNTISHFLESLQFVAPSTETGN
jgi:hypothetical protein